MDWVDTISVSLLDALHFSIPFLKKLQILNLSRSRFGDRSVNKLAEVLMAAVNVTELDLTNIGLTGFGLKDFAEAYLAQNPKNL